MTGKTDRKIRNGDFISYWTHPTAFRLCQLMHSSAYPHVNAVERSSKKTGGIYPFSPTLSKDSVLCVKQPFPSGRMLPWLETEFFFFGELSNILLALMFKKGDAYRCQRDMRKGRKGQRIGSSGVVCSPRGFPNEWVRVLITVRNLKVHWPVHWPAATNLSAKLEVLWKKASSLLGGSSRLNASLIRMVVP